MGWNYSYENKIDLFVKGRILEPESKRQQQTAIALLRRLEFWPGQILADEVGMGKTFVALSVAVSVALHDKKKRPVVIMIPPILRSKWPKDLDVFKEKCLPKEISSQIRYSVAESTVDFLKLLDDNDDIKSNIIFLTHGAFNRSLGDNYVKLAMIQRALHKRRDTEQLRLSLANFGSQLLRFQRKEDRYGNFIDSLMNVDPTRWKQILEKRGLLSEEDDDPVPHDLAEVLYEVETENFESLYWFLKEKMPKRQSPNLNENLTIVRQRLADELKVIWNLCMQKLKIRIPLLILDEAHHLKNAKTRFASLFESSADADEITKGQLANVFERMLFLTATPFQLGHFELCNVMKRFSAITWDNTTAPINRRDTYEKYLVDLGAKLDQAQKAAVRLDEEWQQLNPSDLQISNRAGTNMVEWVSCLKSVDVSNLSTRSQKIAQQFKVTAVQMDEAEKLLKKMVVRHLRSRDLPGMAGKRRLEFPGKSILSDDDVKAESGLPLDSKSLFPFLLAARLTAITPESRPVFAEGLASSFEAFLDTRRRKSKEAKILDKDDDTSPIIINKKQVYYLEEIEHFLNKHTKKSGQIHTKVSATINKAVHLWLQGEKVLVFCHYIATGKSLWINISKRMIQEIKRMASKQIGCNESEALQELDRIGERFDNGPLKEFINKFVGEIINEYDSLVEFKEPLLDVVRRYLRTPSFLIRFFPLEQKRFDEIQIRAAFNKPDFSKQTFIHLLRDFFSFLQERCGHLERQAYIDALAGIQTGRIRGKQVESTLSNDELEGVKADTILPNVRLANGSIKDTTRQKLMLTFNTPFYPDILIASSVMSEGVDLHLNCRYIIHHDLCWNPSTLEQRTGRVDRIGAKAEICKLPINIFYPYISETQDEKMYRVVMDREKWFKVVMGENFKVDTKTTDRLAERIPFPEELAEELSFNLEVK